MCFCSCPTWRHGKCGYLSCRLYFCLKYWATVHSMAWPFSSCKGNLQINGKCGQKNSCLFGTLANMCRNRTYVWWLAGRRVTLQTRYFLFIWPQCVTSTFRPVYKTYKKEWLQNHVKWQYHLTTNSNFQCFDNFSILAGWNCTHQFLFCHFQDMIKKCWHRVFQLCSFPFPHLSQHGSKRKPKRRIESL